MGWNVMPTSRNARGIDILIYNQDASQTHTIQVKALSKRNAVGLGTKREGVLGDFFIICRNFASDNPECFVLKPAEVRKLAHSSGNGSKTQYWLEPKQYEAFKFKEKWEQIGRGAAVDF